MNTTNDQDKPTLLLVDDDEAFRRVLARAMERRGYAVSTAADVPEALAAAQQHPPEYAVVDLKMPGESGLVLIERLMELDPNTRIVMLTGYASIATAIEAIKLGATQYLAKPASADDILAALGHREPDPEQALPEQPMSVRRLTWEHIQRVLAEHDGNVSATARALDMHRRTLQRMLAKRPANR